MLLEKETEILFSFIRKILQIKDINDFYQSSVVNILSEESTTHL